MGKVGADRTPHPGGRPPKWPTPELFAAACNAYFAARAADGQPLTVAGLCVALNLTKQGLLEYGAKPEFSALVAEAKLKIEAYVESRLFGSSPTGAIFWLKNHGGYVDKQEREITGKLTLEDLLAGGDE